MTLIKNFSLPMWIAREESLTGIFFWNPAVNKALERDALNLPDPAPSTDPTWLPEQNVPLPYVFVFDYAIPLEKHCMKSYPQTNLSGGKRIFNYRLTKMLGISKNVFAIWGSRFRVFTTAMALSPKKAVTITTVVLYNMLQTKGRLLYTNEMR